MSKTGWTLHLPRLRPRNHVSCSGPSPLVACASHAGSIQYIQLNGWATTVDWRRVLRPALPSAVADFRRRATSGTIPLPNLSVPRGHPSGHCYSCAVWAMFRPRHVLHRALAGSPIAMNAPLACLKARTMYAEDKRFFPDTLPLRLPAIDQLWRSYSGNLGDYTFWGPRDRLRCRNSSHASHAAQHEGSEWRMHRVARGRGARAGKARGGSPDESSAPLSLVMPSGALTCLETVRQAMGARARLFVAVDAPRLQEVIFHELGERAFITPGVGVDPTNEYRDEAHQRSVARGLPRHDRKPAGQVEGEQDLSERNLIKVSLDYYIQGFCLSSLTLRPSAFYRAAAQRTLAMRSLLWRGVIEVNTTTAGMDACRRAEQHPRSGLLGIEACQRTLCGISNCNLEQ